MSIIGYDLCQISSEVEFSVGFSVYRKANVHHTYPH